MKPDQSTAAAADIFSPIVTYYPNGRITEPVGNIRFSGSCVDYGKSGAVTTQLDFDIYDPFGAYVDQATTEEQYIIVSEKNDIFNPSKKFYVSARSADNGVTHITAYDGISVTNKLFDTTHLLFYNGKEFAVNVINALAEQCGFSGAALPEELVLLELTRTMLEGKTCRAILELFAEAVCGVWYANSSGGLSCYLWGTLPNDVYTADKHTVVDYRGYKAIKSVIVTDSESDVSRKYIEGTGYGTIQIDTPFPSAASGIIGRLGTYEHLAWRCENALMDVTLNYVDFSAVSSIVFDGQRYTANDFTVYVDASGVYFSGGAAHQDDLAWQYQFRADRELEERLRFGKTVGNTQINKDGIVFVNKNTGPARAESGEVKKFGFSVGGSGTTEYAGAMIDKADPEYIEKVDDDTIIVAYPDAKYRCTRTKVGNRYTFETEKIEEGGSG